jgi:aspartyl/glutamyl-tRNA(Asn/Gln) amidotransferase C subunit
VKIDRALLLRLERLARLELAEDERGAMRADLTRILDYAERLTPLAGEGPSAPEAAALREDVVRPSLDRSTALDLAPSVEEGQFLVPPVIAVPGTAREPRDDD